MTDKDIEKRRYDERADRLLESKNFYRINKIPEYLNAPYKCYFRLLHKNAGQLKLLEIGAGMGENTRLLIDMAYHVTSTDISSKSVKVMQKKFSKYSNFSAEIADMENLPFNNESFDVVCIAGSLSYGDNELVMSEIYRVLRKGGIMVAVDSLNNNPLYRLNRYIHYLKGRRSKSTLLRMPTMSLINKYAKKFGYAEVKFFGAVVWSFPLLSIIFSERILTAFSEWIDATFNIKKLAFKFVLLVKKNEV